jgi:hypothetical protein
MSDQGMQMLLERWTEDESFRKDLRSDPEGAASNIGADLSEEQREFLRSVDWTLSDQELEALLNKAWSC